MSTTLKITVLPGNSPALANAVGPFAMNRKVVREFDGYPILTDDDTTWYIGMIGSEIVGFSSTRKMKSYYEITASYTVLEHRGKGYFKKILDKQIADCKEGEHKLIVAFCTAKSLNNFHKAGFVTIKEMKGWTKVEKQL